MMLSSGSHAGQVARCQELGIACYMSKPVKQSELSEAIKRALRDHDSLARPTATPPASAAAPIPAAGPKSLKVLVAEDTLVNQRVVIGMLEKRGHTVSLATTGREAVTEFERGVFDVILMDVQMPDMDGLEATVLIREIEKASGGHIPIIAMTANAMKGDRERCLDSGMDHYLPKPVNFDELFALMSGLPASGARPQPAPAPQPTAAFNKDELLEVMDNNLDFLRELAGIFFEERPKMLSQIKDAALRRDAAAVRQAGHKKKGSVSNFRATRAAEAAHRIEEFDASKDFPSLDPDIEDLTRELECFETELKALIEKEH